MAAKPAPVGFGPYMFIWDGRGYVPDPASWPTDQPAVPPQVEMLTKAAKRARQAAAPDGGTQRD